MTFDRPPSVLLSETDDMIRAAIAANLRSDGCDVIWGKTAAATIQAAARSDIDIAILGDLGTGLTRSETVRLIRMLPKPAGGLPIIALLSGVGASVVDRPNGAFALDEVTARQPDMLHMIITLSLRRRGVAPDPVLLPGATEVFGDLPMIAVDQVLNSLGRSFAALASEVQAAETDRKMRSAVHGIKGVMANLGGGPLLDLCHFVEELAAATSWPDTRWALPLLERGCRAVQEAGEAGALVTLLGPTQPIGDQ